MSEAPGGTPAYTLLTRNASGQLVSAVTLSAAPTLIGRAEDCGIVLPSVSVSRRHASIWVQQDGAVLISDEGSANGVQVNGHYIKGPTEIDDSSQIEVGEFVLSLEMAGETEQLFLHKSRSPAAQADADTVHPHGGSPQQPPPACGLQLVGRDGPYDGVKFPLTQQVMNVGRAPDSQLLLEDPSISRRHAQLRQAPEGGAFDLLDLRSANGTYLDGQRIKRHRCGEGSIIRFGDLAFKVTVQRQRVGVKKGKRSPRRRLLLAASAIVLLLSMVGVYAYLNRPPPLETEVITPEQRLRAIQAQVQRLVDEGRRRISLKEWQEAVEVLDQAQKEDPLNAAAKRLRQQALAELDNEKTFTQAMNFFALGNSENLLKAKAVFLRLPEGSIYHREARYKIKAIDERLAADYRVEGVSRCKSRYWEQCHEALCKFFELLPADAVVVNEEHLREMLQGVQKRLARHKKIEPCKAQRFLHGSQLVQAAEDPETVLAERYESPELREVLVLYLGGKIDPSIKLLSRLSHKRELRPHLEKIREIDRQLLIIRGKYQEGYSAYRDRNLDDMQREWGLVLEADRALLGDRLESFFRREVKRLMGELYYEFGDEQFKATRYRQAFELLRQGRQMDPKNEQILNGLLQLEKEAERLVRQAKELAEGGNAAEARVKLKLATDITDEDRSTHQDAVQALKAVP